MSEPAREMATPQALRDWCRVTCAGYPGVDVRDMSSSFRDGLAFCAIIHKHRPDLIDFCSLSKDNVYQNNKLAFEVAESKLGIPALLDPKEMVSMKVPDYLSIITYLSRYYYYFFTRRSHGPAGSMSPQSKTPNSLKPLKSSTHLETGKDLLSSTRLRTVCNLCFRPVHLVQRHLINGKIYHRDCFRCKLCHKTLLPESYTKGSDSGSLICTHHITDSKITRTDASQQSGFTENRPKCTYEAAVTSVPHYTKQMESQDRLVCKSPETEQTDSQERSREVRHRDDRHSAGGVKSVVKKPPHPPPSRVEDRTVEGAGKAGPAPVLTDSETQQEASKTRQPSEPSSPCVQEREGSDRPVPAPRRMLDPAGAPVPAPRTRSSQKTNSSTAAGCLSNQSKSPMTSPTSGHTKVKSNHPWMGIVHPGPWTQLPPAPAPVPTPRSRSASNLRGPWYRPKVPPPNPFAEDMDEGTHKEAMKPESTDQTKSSFEACHSENSDNLTNKSADGEVTVCQDDDNNVKLLEGSNSQKTADSLPDVSEAAAAVAAAGAHVAANETQVHLFPRSISVPAITSTHTLSSSVPAGLTDTDESVTSRHSKTACKENPFDRKPSMPKSKTFQDLPSRRAPAPGHGFPLIKRKVQTDQCLSTEDLQMEMGELEKQLEMLEKRGLELERDLRGSCQNDKEEQMFMEWFSLMHEKQVLVRRDTELVYLSKQQNLEERQADVEYELRCLLNKPESDWSQEDRDQEEQMMDELVSIIEQRNQIISSLDQDRQREREEDLLWQSSVKSKEFQKDGLKDLKKSKGKFKPTSVFKMLNQRAESTKNLTDKKS